MKKGQSAMEFLITYGWAFLLALIMIGALSYFDILRPRDLLPSRCFFIQANCEDYKISYEEDEIRLKLYNNLGRTVIVWGAYVDNTSRVVTECQFQNPFEGKSGDDAVWNRGEPIDFTFTDCNFEEHGLKQGSKETFQIKISYRAQKSAVDHTMNGQVFTFIE